MQSRTSFSPTLQGMIFEFISLDHQGGMGLELDGHGFPGVSMTMHLGNCILVLTISDGTITVVLSVGHGKYVAITDNIQPKITTESSLSLSP